ncbi:hypothetical protein AB0H63_27090 [Micromonospora echinospora]|uniref:hypothetical protein n=1 Tax=Micromonospora echinospora TaxID=1877 RepID=UPI0033EED897
MGGFLLCLILGFMMIMFSLNEANRWLELAAVASFFAGICYFIALFTMFSYVKATADGLIIVNPGSAYRLPWSELRRLKPEGGLSVELKNGEIVFCFAFQPSLLGRMLGYPAARRAIRKIEKFRAQGVPAAAGRGTSSEVPWRRHVHWIVGIWVSLALMIPALVRLLPGVLT